MNKSAKENKIKKAAQKMRAFFRNIKPADAAAVAGVLVLAGIIIVPSLIVCGENRQKNDCMKHMYRLRTAITEEIEREAENGGSYWQSMILNGNYKRLLEAANNKTIDGDAHPASDYYIHISDNKLQLICKKHKDVSIGELNLSSIPNVSLDVAEQGMTGDNIICITVSGPDTYYVNEPLDTNDPEKTIYYGNDLDAVLSNLTVTAIYSGGYRAELAREDYSIYSEPLDITKPGETSLIIKTNSNSVWQNSVYAGFRINVIGADDIPPLIIDAGINGKYELAAWDWKDFVAEAAAEKDGKEFDASIIRQGDKYYYYPDGLYIDNKNPNTTSFDYALDADGSGEKAYCIPFDTESVILNSSDAAKIHNGSVRAEDGRVYIWQDEKSRELDRGWIRVYCEIKKY